MIEIPKIFDSWPLRSLPSILVTDDFGSPYLTRVYLNPNRDWWRRGLGLPGMYAHFFWRGDHDRELHNHPWARSYSLILAHGYEEERMVGGTWDPVLRTYTGGRIEKRLLLPGSINRIDHDTFHRVTLLEPAKGCWTFFVAGDKVPGKDGENWGFISRDGQRYETCGERDRRLAREKAA